MSISRKIESERRSAIEREDHLVDLGERYEADLAAETTNEGKTALMQAFAKVRQELRQKEVDAGRRSRGLSVLLHQILWARWIEVAVENEMRARAAFVRAKTGEQQALVEDFRASLVAISASAHVIEALFGEVKYRIPPQARLKKRYLDLGQAFTMAFGLDKAASDRLLADLTWLFDRRDLAVHPYAQAEPPQHHPAGYLTGAEFSDFNAVTSGRAVDLAMALLEISQAPPKPANRAIARWAEKRQPYHLGVLPLRALRAASPFPPS